MVCAHVILEPQNAYNFDNKSVPGTAEINVVCDSCDIWQRYESMHLACDATTIKAHVYIMYPLD